MAARLTRRPRLSTGLARCAGLPSGLARRPRLTRLRLAGRSGRLAGAGNLAGAVLERRLRPGDIALELAIVAASRSASDARSRACSAARRSSSLPDRAAASSASAASARARDAWGWDVAPACAAWRRASARAAASSALIEPVRSASSSRSSAASSGSPSGLRSSSPLAARDADRASWVSPASRSAARGSVMRDRASCMDPMRASVASRSAPSSRSCRASSRSCRSSSSRRGSGLSTFSSPTSSAISSTRSATRSAASRAARRWSMTVSCGFGHATSSRVMARPPAAMARGRRAIRGRNARRRSTAFSWARASASCLASSGSSV